MLEVKCEEYLEKVRKQADELGLRAKLEEQLEYLATYGCSPEDPERCKCILMSDFAPLSFFFEIQGRQPNGSYATWFVGGCIFYGKGDSGAGAPQFSVRFGEGSDAGWSIHT